MIDEVDSNQGSSLPPSEKKPNINDSEAVIDFLFSKTLFEYEKQLESPIIKKAQQLNARIDKKYEYHKLHIRAAYISAPWDIINLIMFYRHFGDELPIEEDTLPEVLTQRRALIEKCKSDEFIDDCVIATYLHEVGYIEGPNGHEKRGADMTGKELRNFNHEESRIQDIKSAILDTEIIRTESGFRFKRPSNFIAALLMDADTANFGKKDNRFMTGLIAAELGISEDDINFLIQTLQLMQNHKWQTDAAKWLFGEQKAKNIQALKERIQAAHNPPS